MKTTKHQAVSSHASRVRKIARTLCVPRVVDFLQYLHRVGAPATLLAVPQYVPLGLHVPVDETANRGPERLLLVRTCTARVRS